jgi:hypothetical protein
LKRKVNGKTIEFDVIKEVDLYKCEPWDLPDKSCLGSNDQEWYFFSARDKKYPNGSRTNRATEAGYWKSTGKDRVVQSGQRTIGMKKTLVYYRGRAPRGERTDWVMHEYRMDDEVYEKLQGYQEAFVLARIFKKSGPGPKNGEQYGAVFVEEAYRSPSPAETQDEPPLESEDVVTDEAPAMSEHESAIKTEPVDPVEERQDEFYELVSTEKALEELLGEGVISTTLTFPGPGEWDGFPEPELELGEYAPVSAEDDLLLQEMVDVAQVTGLNQGTSLDQQGGEAWRDAVIDSFPWGEEDHNDGDYVTNNMVSFNGGVGQFTMNSASELGFDDVGTGDFLEMNDILGPAGGQEFFYPRETGIQLRPRRSSVTTMQLNSQGAAARRILLRRPQSQVEDVASFDVSNTWDQDFSGGGVDIGTDGCRSILDKDLLSYTADFPVSQSSAEQSARSTSSQGIAENAELNVAGSVASTANSEEDYESLFSFLTSEENFAPRLSLPDPQRAGVHHHRGSLQPDVIPPLAADSTYSWQQPDLSPPPPLKTLKPAADSSKSSKLSGINSFMPILPASAAELPGFSSTYVTATETHLTAFTITCLRSEDGAKHVQAAVTDYAGGKVHQEVVSGTWTPCTDDCKQQGCAQCGLRRRPQRQVTKGSRSGYVFVFLLGAVSALVWFLLLRGTWRVAQHMYNTIL